MSLTRIEKISFTRHLSIMIKSGITVNESLQNLSESAKTRSARELINNLSLSIQNGSTLNTALEKYPRIFDDFYRGIVRVGEATGRLDTSLSYLAEELNKDYTLEKKVRGALMYPGLVLASTIGMGGFISLYILPKLVDFFTAFESQLPPATLFLLKTALFMKSYGVWLFSALAILAVFTAFLVTLPPVKPIYHRFILHLPLFGNLIREREISRFSRNLGILIKSGLPVFEALDITARSQTNLAYKLTIQSLAKNLEKGKNIAVVLRRSAASFLFPRLVSDMLSVGEKTGSIDESLLYVSQFYQEDIEETARNLTTILEPVLLIIIGLVVGFMALAIISPIYQLTGAIG